jgi:hypothetical protein
MLSPQVRDFLGPLQRTVQITEHKARYVVQFGGSLTPQNVNLAKLLEHSHESIEVFGKRGVQILKAVLNRRSGRHAMASCGDLPLRVPHQWQAQTTKHVLVGGGELFGCAWL